MDYIVMLLLIALLIILIYVVRYTGKSFGDKDKNTVPKTGTSRIVSLIKQVFIRNKLGDTRKKKKSYDPLFDVKLTGTEIFILVLFFGFIGVFVSWYFYLNVVVSLAFSIAFQLLFIPYTREKKKKRKNDIIDEFINLNHLLLAELQTGVSVSLAYERIYAEMKKSEILDFKYLEPEIKVWINKIHTGSDIGDIILEFANRSDEKSLIQFANMLDIASKRGGNILDIIVSTNTVLNDERQMHYDLEVLVTEKKLEQRVITVMPIFILMFLNYSAYDFIAPLYESIIGRITMTILLLVFTISYFWSKKITELRND